MAEAPPLRRIVRPTPCATRVLVGINAAVFLAMVLTGVSPTQPTNAQLLRWGANWGPLALDGQLWRMLTSNYVHIGIVHIALNMWCLWDLGRLSELIFGRWTLLLLYTACGLAGSIASLWFHPLVTGAGASGAIFGLAGALIAALYLGKLPFPKQGLQRTLKSLLTFAGYNLLFGAVGRGIDNSAHIGGLVMGLGLGAILGQFLMEPHQRRNRLERYVFAAAALVLIVAGLDVRASRGYVVQLVQAENQLQKGQVDTAIGNLQQVVARNRQNNLALLLLGNAYLQKKDYAQAESVLKQAQANDPDDLGVQYYLGLVYGETNRYEEARQIFAKLTQSNPKDDDGWTMLGTALDGLGREQEAVQALQRAISLNPRNAEAHRELGLAWLKMKQADSAIAELQQATQLDPKSAQAQHDLGNAYLMKGMKPESDAAFQKAEELQAGHATPTRQQP
jgi:membrane associated rhomboid family serine protease/cytochrome c-type biogenesis protein CcmH/NrfG